MYQCYHHLHLQLVLHSHSPSLPFPLIIPNVQTPFTSQHGSFGFITTTWKRRRNGDVHSKKWCIYAIEKESKFEVDQDKARQALDELDQQLEFLSRKQVNPPKIRASSLSNMKEQMKEGNTEISGSFLSFTAFGLFLFTIFYNILFITVIKPAIDGP